MKEYPQVDIMAQYAMLLIRKWYFWIRPFEPLSKFTESYGNSGTCDKLSTNCINTSSVNVFKNRNI